MATLEKIDFGYDNGQKRGGIALLQLPALPSEISCAKVPEWGSDRSPRPCPVCRSQKCDVVTIRPDRVQVARCSCGMLYVPAVPNLSKFYENYVSYKGFERSLPKRLYDRVRCVYSCPDAWLSILESTGGIKAKSVVDFGASNGRNLKLAKYRGAGHIYAVEIDSTALDALRRSGISCSSSLDEAPVVDILYSLQVIEHLVDPLEVLILMRQKVRTGGRLLLAMPNGGEVDKFGASWIGFRVDLEHLNYFNLRTIGEALRNSGFILELGWEHSQPNLFKPAGLGPGTFDLTILARAI